MTELSGYTFTPLRPGADFTHCRGRWIGGPLALLIEAVPPSSKPLVDSRTKSRSQTS